VGHAACCDTEPPNRPQSTIAGLYINRDQSNLHSIKQTSCQRQAKFPASGQPVKRCRRVEVRHQIRGVNRRRHPKAPGLGAGPHRHFTATLTLRSISLEGL
jgi:hypothetical protein